VTLDERSRRRATRSRPSWGEARRRHLHRGGTESCDLAIAGVTSHHRRTHDTSEILISRVEHHAVSDAAEKMARDHDDVSVGYIDVDADGVVDLDSLMSRLSDDTAIVSVMAATTKPGFDSHWTA